MPDNRAQPLARFRDAACLAHSVPGVSLRISESTGGQDVLVSSSYLGAPLDPCRFRAIVVAAMSGRLAVLGRYTSVDVVGGLVHLGGGLFQPSHRSGDRWFVSTLDHQRITDLVEACPLVAAAGFSVVVKPDPDLSRCAVRVRCENQSAARDLDEVALWSLATCLVDELIISTATSSA